VQISPAFSKCYPKLSKLILANLRKAKEKPRVWAAFLKYSELKAQHAIEAVKDSPTPIIHSKVMPRANGQFSGSKEPNNIYLAEAICRRFEEKESSNPKMHLLVESTILHEMVHWGDWKDGKDQPHEEGKEFEKAAYGADVNRYW
jgi:hypothetical protein